LQGNRIILYLFIPVIVISAVSGKFDQNEVPERVSAGRNSVSGETKFRSYLRDMNPYTMRPFFCFIHSLVCVPWVLERRLPLPGLWL
jgi:hypothetical protein